MANIDVSDLLTDPDFVDPLLIIRRTPTVNQYGENTLTEIAIRSMGSVQPASGQTILRLPEAMRVANVCSFWIKGKITSDGTSAYPDIIVFKGVRFEVQVVFDWMNYGQGYCEGTCIRQQVSL